MNTEFVLAGWMQRHQQRVANALEQRLANLTPAGQLIEAMRYATLGRGKRLRALLVYATGEAVQADLTQLDAMACAVEMMHAYSLVHDDMPMMDDDDLRRGKPSCHKAFDEATALLAGDALQTEAFMALSDNALAAEQQIAMVQVLAAASGAAGMAAGQAIDLASVGKSLTLQQLQNMHQLKTGALIRASVKLGALASPQIQPETLVQLDQYANALGLAFQVQDDVLDVTADTATLGKQQGADIALNKPTYPALMGLEAAKKKANALIQEALDCLHVLPDPCFALTGLAQYVVKRNF